MNRVALFTAARSSRVGNAKPRKPRDPSKQFYPQPPMDWQPHPVQDKQLLKARKLPGVQGNIHITIDMPENFPQTRHIPNQKIPASAVSNPGYPEWRWMEYLEHLADSRLCTFWIHFFFVEGAGNFDKLFACPRGQWLGCGCRWGARGLQTIYDITRGSEVWLTFGGGAVIESFFSSLRHLLNEYRTQDKTNVN